MPNQEEIDAVIKMLDKSMQAGTGHINVLVNEKQEIVTEEVTVAKGDMCDFGDTACSIPNLPTYDD